jgi:hypothetical protein
VDVANIDPEALFRDDHSGFTVLRGQDLRRMLEPRRAAGVDRRSSNAGVDACPLGCILQAIVWLCRALPEQIPFATLIASIAESDTARGDGLRKIPGLNFRRAVGQTWKPVSYPDLRFQP